MPTHPYRIGQRVKIVAGVRPAAPADRGEIRAIEERGVTVLHDEAPFLGDRAAQVLGFESARVFNWMFSEIEPEEDA